MTMESMYIVPIYHCNVINYFITYIILNGSFYRNVSYRFKYHRTQMVYHCNNVIVKITVKHCFSMYTIMVFSLISIGGRTYMTPAVNRT